MKAIKQSNTFKAQFLSPRNDVVYSALNSFIWTPLTQTFNIYNLISFNDRPKDVAPLTEY